MTTFNPQNCILSAPEIRMTRHQSESAKQLALKISEASSCMQNATTRKQVPLRQSITNYLSSMWHGLPGEMCLWLLTLLALRTLWAPFKLACACVACTVPEGCGTCMAGAADTAKHVPTPTPTHTPSPPSMPTMPMPHLLSIHLPPPLADQPANTDLPHQAISYIAREVRLGSKLLDLHHQYAAGPVPDDVKAASHIPLHVTRSEEWGECVLERVLQVVDKLLRESSAGSSADAQLARVLLEARARLQRDMGVVNLAHKVPPPPMVGFGDGGLGDGMMAGGDDGAEAAAGALSGGDSPLGEAPAAVVTCCCC